MYRVLLALDSSMRMMFVTSSISGRSKVMSVFLVRVFITMMQFAPMLAER